MKRAKDHQSESPDREVPNRKEESKQKVKSEKRPKVNEDSK